MTARAKDFAQAVSGVRIKICGLTRLEDALSACRLGADALGFIFAPASPRRISPVRCRAIVAALPPFVTPVGVFMNQPVDWVLKTALFCGLRAVQLHGSESAAAVRALKAGNRIIVIKTLGEHDIIGPSRRLKFPADAWLLDSAGPDGSGGTGRATDWKAAAGFISGAGKPVILAGGLNPENVARAIAVCRPYGVDVCSGVEARPGVKHAGKMGRFITSARAAS